MKIELTSPVRTVMSAPDSPRNYFGWPSVARLKNGRIAVAASGNRLEHVCPFGQAVMSLSEDEAETFSPPAPVINTPLDDRDAGLCAFGESGLILTSFNNEIAFQRNYHKDDPSVQGYLDALTEAQEKKYLGSTFRVSRDNGVTFGEIHKSPVTSPHGPCELKDGRLLWVGRTFRPGYGHTPDFDGIEAHFLLPDGSTEYAGTIENIGLYGVKPLLCEPHAVVLDNGNILCHIRAEHYGEPHIFTTLQSVSKDNGKTWSVPRPLLSVKGGAPAHLLKMPGGDLISVYGYREEPYGIRVMLSRDNGETWDTDNELVRNGVDDDLGYPATVLLNDGGLFTVFYAHPDKYSPAVIQGVKWKYIP